MGEVINVRRDELKRFPPPQPRAAATFTAEPIWMSIFTRTRDIVAANVTDLLDKAEDPAKMIRMIILEMEETLVEVRASSARTFADQRDLREQIARLQQAQLDWADKAELALSKDRDDLARAALAEKQKAADLAECLEIEIGVLDDALRAADRDVAKLQAKLRDARVRQNAIAARMESAANRLRLRELHGGSRIDEALSRFEQLERRADMADGAAEALALASPKRTLEEEIAGLRASDQVEAELAALKARRANHATAGA